MASSASTRPDTPDGLFAARLGADPTRPLLTFYDDDSGERAELSARSLANWVAKTHFLLVDELGLTVGDRAFVALPVHWLAAPILLGCWTAGLEVVSTPQSCQVAFADATFLRAQPQLDADDIFAVSLLSMARAAEPPAGAQDYATAVRPQPDSWASVRPQAEDEHAALDAMSRTEVVAAAHQAAAELGLTEGGRLLWTRDWQQPADWIASLLAPLAVGGSVVLVRSVDPARIAAKAATEGATVIH